MHENNHLDNSTLDSTTNITRVSRSLREIRKQLAQAAEWKTELERMKTGAVVGCLHVESKSMRTALTQIPDTIMQQVCLLAAHCVPYAQVGLGVLLRCLFL